MNDKRPSIKRIRNLSRARTNERIYPDLAPAITRVTNAGERVKNAGLFLFNFITESMYPVRFSLDQTKVLFYLCLDSIPHFRAKLYFILGGETYCDELNKMRRYVFDEYTRRDTFNEILFVNFSMKIVYSLSLLRSIEIPFFVYLFRNYSPFYAVSFMSLFDFLSFSSPSLSPSFQLFHVSHTIYFILGKCCRQTQRRNAAFYGIRSSGLRLRAV